MKRIFTVGFELPGDDFEHIPFESDQSLLDADIVLFKVCFGQRVAASTFQGERLFDKTTSVQVLQNLEHWRAELASAANAGKLVIVYLAKPLSCFRHTGDQQVSGTGRSRNTIDMVDRIDSYHAVPDVISAVPKSGREVRITKEGAYLAGYWKTFGQYSPYEVFVEGKFTHAILTTKTGGNTVAAAVWGNGALLFLPPIRCETTEFTKYDAKKKETFWTPAAMRLGKQLVASLIGIYNVILSGRNVTPPPHWASDATFGTPEESVLQADLAKVGKQLTRLQQRRTELEATLGEAGRIRALLYEQGKPLERAVLDALAVLGFSAEPFAEGDSEFDAVFQSPEGRCLGEVEGKDNKPINIDKLSQLERNLQEDFAQDDVSGFAKGVLFGNGERLLPPSERSEAFTAKCVIAARRARIALVRTADLFAPTRYLRSHSDAPFAEECRKAIFAAEGAVVEFPAPPLGYGSSLEERIGDAGLGPADVKSL